MTKISSLDDGYQSGDLSVYPQAIDDKDTLYDCRNNASTILSQSLSYNSKKIIVESTAGFPPSGMIRIGAAPGDSGAAELIFYASKSNNTFFELSRGHAGSRQNFWNKGANVSNAVMAEHHNAVKDAILNIETTLGTSISPAEDSFNGRLKKLENKFLSPKPIFRAFPLKGKTNLSVSFQNFSEGDTIRFLWDFGDGTTSIEKNPIHVYANEGFYTVKLNVITSSGAQGVSVKNNYIKISEEEITPFFYYELLSGTNAAPAEFLFVDQTDGNIVQRFWIFDDGSTEAVLDPDIHTITHTYDTPGTYLPSLLLILADEKLKRVFLNEEIIVI